MRMGGLSPQPWWESDFGSLNQVAVLMLPPESEWGLREVEWVNGAEAMGARRGCRGRYRFSHDIGSGDNKLLGKHHLFYWESHTKIASADMHTVSLPKNAIYVAEPYIMWKSGGELTCFKVEERSH